MLLHCNHTIISTSEPDHVRKQKMELCRLLQQVRPDAIVRPGAKQSEDQQQHSSASITTRCTTGEWNQVAQKHVAQCRNTHPLLSPNPQTNGHQFDTTPKHGYLGARGPYRYRYSDVGQYRPLAIGRKAKALASKPTW